MSTKHGIITAQYNPQMQYNVEIEMEDSGSGDNNIFVIRAVETTETTGTFNKTVTEIREAITAGKIPIVIGGEESEQFADEVYSPILVKYDANDITLRFTRINEEKTLSIMTWDNQSEAYELDVFPLQEKTQFLALPEASADYVGKIYQYIGSTGSGFTKGYFYECVASGSTYTWQHITV